MGSQLPAGGQGGISPEAWAAIQGLPAPSPTPSPVPTPSPSPTPQPGAIASMLKWVTDLIGSSAAPAPGAIPTPAPGQNPYDPATHPAEYALWQEQNRPRPRPQPFVGGTP